MGIKERIKNVIGRASWANRIQEQVDTLYYFLNKYVDIKSVPHADGELRKLQLCGAEMLAIFDDLCDEHGLAYWLDFGTLLGAARHNGYIPWDDDLDVSMPRKDWNRAAKLLPPILESNGFYVRVYSESWFGFGYQRDETGLWMDVFCYETAYPAGDSGYRDRLLREIDEQLDFCRRNMTFNTNPLIDRDVMRAHRLGLSYSEERETMNDDAVLFLSPEIESNLSKCVFDAEDFFPLGQLEFEGLRCPVPSNWDVVLTAYYGKYNEFPREGILHHGLNGVPLADIAKAGAVDLDVVLSDLRLIRKRLVK